MFEILYRSKRSNARVGRIHTPHGIIDTPNFVAVGTNGTIKALPNYQHSELGLQLMFCNTYHLLVQPGTQVIQQAGGIHRFIQRDLPIITDSGGFQIFSLAYHQVKKELKGQSGKKHPNSVLKVTEEGVTFRSYRDGRKIFLSPETAVQAQKEIGADIIIPLDELLPFHVEETALKTSFDRTHRWELRSLAYHRQNVQNQAMFGVVHGGIDLALRQQSCHQLGNAPFDGFAIGGSLGCDHAQMLTTVSGTTPYLPPEKPRHLLGIGDLTSIALCVPHGIDTFDSCYPTKTARHGMLLTQQGALKLSRQCHATDFTPIERECTCYTCQHYTRAYLHHLFKAKEPAGISLATLHNVHFMIHTMARLRTEILCGLI